MAMWTLMISCFILKVDAITEPLTQKLYQDLIRKSNYEPDVIPLTNKSIAVEVKFGLSLQQIISLDAQNENFVAMVWLNEEWKDPRLEWQQSEYNNVHSIRIKEDNIWMPDIRLYNSRAESRPFTTHVVVYSDGTCSWVPPVEITVTCTFDFTWFPFDTQYCNAKYGSWTYDGTKVNLTSMRDEIDISTFSPNREWDLLSVPAVRHVQHYACCPEPYIDINFTMEMKRRGSKYLFEFIVPAVVLSSLIPVLFIMRPDDSSRFALGGGMLVSIFLLINLLANVMPRELSSRPVLGTYYDMMFILVSLALAITAFISNIVYKSDGLTPPPVLAKQILLKGLGRVLCISYSAQYGAPTVTEADNIALDTKIRDVNSSVYEWNLIGQALDRFFFIIFLITVIIGSLVILPK